MSAQPNLRILSLSCPDRPGLVAAVAGCLHENHCNIEEAAQFNDQLSGRFFMRVVFRPKSDQALQDFHTAFTALSDTLDMNWTLHNTAEKVRTAIMVSQWDHCLNDLLYRTHTDHLPLEITAIISNHEEAAEHAARHGIRFHHMHVRPENKKEQESEQIRMLDETNTELIILARYMQILSNSFCARYPGRIINIHHSFLPGFKGAKPYTQAYERGVKLIGATAHFVTADLDEGPIIAQDVQSVDHSYTPQKMQALGRDIEALTLARAVQLYGERRIFLEGLRTVIL